MKPESIKSILRSYLKERQYSSECDDIDGFADGVSGYLSGEPFAAIQGRAADYLYMEPELANLPLDELDYVPLEPEQEAIAVVIGRQLSQLSDEFERVCVDEVTNQDSADERSIYFKEHIIRVSPTSNRISIPVVRTAATDSVASVEWRTCNKSAKAGLHYVHSQGSISFTEGEEEKTIEVEIIRGQSRKTDICFAVELFDAEGTYNTFMVYIVDDSKFYPEEKQVVDNIFSCARNISVSEIATRLSDKVTHKTFKAALLCLCSSVDSIPKELALASELLRLTIPHARLSSLTNIFCEYFSDYPELEDVATLF